MALDLIRDEAESLTLHINGFSLHFKQNDQNEFNYGAGASYAVGTLDSNYAILNGAKMAYEFDIYNDSYEKPAAFGGIGLKKPYKDMFNYGVLIGLVHSDELLESGKPLFPAIVPLIETRTGTAYNMRAVLVPPFGDVTNGELIFQFLIDIW